MKKFVIGAAFAIFGLSMVNAQAVENSFCNMEYEKAYNIMKLRQYGTEKAVVESVIYTESGQIMVELAYDKEIVPDRVKPIVMKTFANRFKIICEQSFAESKQKSIAF